MKGSFVFLLPFDLRPLAPQTVLTVLRRLQISGLWQGWDGRGGLAVFALMFKARMEFIMTVPSGSC